MLKKILGILGTKKQESASIAKERLQIVVSHHRRSQSTPDFIRNLQQDILRVLKKYIDVDDEQVQVSIERDSGQSVLELNVTLPEGEEVH